MPSIAHVAHCLVLLTLFYLVNQFLLYYKANCSWQYNLQPNSILSLTLYVIIFVLSAIPLFGRLYMTTLNIIGLIVYDCFPGPVQLKADWSKLPRISFRIVTRGDYRDMIWENTKLIKSICYGVGLKNFIVEIVTEKGLDLPRDSHVTQILVPKNYKTKSGTLFKGRNLQYCLEDGVSCLDDRDWIVHLDEDSKPTTDSIKGIANFIHEGKYQYGTGRISYDPDNITGPLTKLLIAGRAVWDYGVFRLQCKTLNRFPVVIKGSFIVCNVAFEKEIGFEGGSMSSIFEFIYFSFAANYKGYRIGWVEGEFQELGTLTVTAFVSQTSRSGALKNLSENVVFQGRGLFWIVLNTCGITTMSLDFVPFFTLFLMNLHFHHTPWYLYLMTLNITHNLYNGIFYLYLKYETFGFAKSLFFLAVIFSIGAIFPQLVYTVGFCKGMLNKTVSFKVTQKTL